MFEVKNHLNLLALRWLESPPSPETCTPADLERIAASLVEALAPLGALVYYGYPMPNYLMIELKEPAAPQSWNLLGFGLLNEGDTIAQSIGRALLPDVKGFIGNCSILGNWHILKSDYQQPVRAQVLGDCPASQFSRFFCDSIRVGLQYINSSTLRISLHDPAKNIELMRTMAEGIAPNFDQIGNALAQAIEPQINAALDLGVYGASDLTLSIYADFPKFEKLRAVFYREPAEDWLVATKLAALAEFVICGNPE